MSDNRSSELPNMPDRPGSETSIQTSPPIHLISGSATNADDNTRYELLEEIARGAMGIVFRAYDRVLNREVGVKTLLSVPAEGSVMASRFRAEAHITSQLQHPNIPPVHDLGTLPDGRPFLAMKLIKGRTLNAMLKSRIHPSHEPGRYLAIFESIAQGVAYAHDHHVLHRDLKPLNVMVGNFGEVQVMDWGLAKHLTDTTSRTLPDSDVETGPSTEIRPLRDEDDETRPGSIFGTPAYMPREQAIGAIDQIDTRSDVFCLGGILCAIFTGKPPYVGENAEATRQLAAIAKLDDAFARLDACDAEPDLIALCKRCLSAERDQRPRDAGEVAKAVAKLRSEAEERARQAKLDRVRAEGEREKAKLQVAEQRKRRRVQLSLLATVMLLLGGVGAFLWWEDKQATEARNKAEQARDGVSAGLKMASDLRKQYKFKEAEATLAQALRLAKSGAPERLGEVEQAQRDLVFVVKLDDIRFRKWIWIAKSGANGRFNTKIASPEYRQIFADRGLDLTSFDVTEAAKLIATSAVKAELVAAVDDWALYEPNDKLRDRLLEIARKADPGSWTDRLRDPAVWKDKTELAKLAADADPRTTVPATLSVLAKLMERNELNPSSLLSSARNHHPTDFELAFALGQWHYANSKGGQQIGPYEAARAIRPENPTVWNNLGVALHDKGDVDGAIMAYNKAIELDPKDANAYYNLGVALDDKKDVAGAIAAYEKAIELDSTYAAAYFNLGNALDKKGNLDGAIAAYKKAIEFEPKLAQAHINLGVALQGKDVDGAIAAYKKAIELEPKLAQAHINLGVIYSQLKMYPEAIACARAAIEANPKNSYAHVLLGFALRETGDIPGARAALTEAVRLDKRWTLKLAMLPKIPTAPPPHEPKRP